MPVTHLLLLEGVDDGALPHVGVTNDANADLLLVRVQLGELYHQTRARERVRERDKRAYT